MKIYKILKEIVARRHKNYDLYRQNEKTLETLFDLDAFITDQKVRILDKNFKSICEVPDDFAEILKDLAEELMKKNELEKIIYDKKIYYRIQSSSNYFFKCNFYFIKKFLKFAKDLGLIIDKKLDAMTIYNAVKSQSYESLSRSSIIHHEIIHFILDNKFHETLENFNKWVKQRPVKFDFENINKVFDEIFVFYIQAIHDENYFNRIQKKFKKISFRRKLKGHLTQKKYLVGNTYVWYSLAYIFFDFMKHLSKNKSMTLENIYGSSDSDLSKIFISYIYKKSPETKKPYMILLSRFIRKMIRKCQKYKIDEIDKCIKWAKSEQNKNYILRIFEKTMEEYTEHSNIIDLNLFDKIKKFNDKCIEFANQFKDNENFDLNKVIPATNKNIRKLLRNKNN